MTTAKTVLDFLEEEIQECTDIDVVRRNIKDAPSRSETEAKWTRREIEIVIAEASVEAPKCTDPEVAKNKYMNAIYQEENNIWVNRSHEINYPDTALEASQCTDAGIAEQKERKAPTHEEEEIWKDRSSTIRRDKVIEEISQCVNVAVAKQEYEIALFGGLYEEWSLKWVELADAEAERDVPKCIDAEVALQKSIDAPPDSKAQIAWTALRHELVRDEISKCVSIYVAKWNCEEALSKEEKEMWEARWIDLRWLQ